MKEKKIKVFECFAGYGGASWALKKANIPFECIGVSEIDKYAKQCFTQNHKGFHYGDITKINPKELPDFDLLTGGFPCQAFSIAGKRKGFEDTRGTLIYDILRIAAEKKPRYMLLENVKGLLNHNNGNTFSTIISALKSIGYDVRYKVLNSKEYGIPQNRERIWIICDREGFTPFLDLFPHKEKLTRFVKDILDDEVDDKYYLSEKAIAKIKRSKFGQEPITRETKNTNCLTAGYYKIPSDGVYIADFRNDEGLRVRKDNISPCLNARAREDIFGMPIVHSLQPRSGDPTKGGTGPLNRDDGVTYCLDTGNSQAIEKDKSWRRLTPIECFRLMGFEDGEINIEGISDTQCYKMAGNGWDVNLVSKILKKWLKN